jgi:hypothetical protein
VLAQRAATGKAEALVSAGWVGEMEGPRWMRARETTSIPKRSGEEWGNGMCSANARSGVPTLPVCAGGKKEWERSRV